MRLSLSESVRHKYSPTEAALFALIAKSKKPLTLNDLALAHYAPGSFPLNWQPILRVTLTQLVKKMEANKEKLRVEKIKTPGEKALTYTLKKA